MIEAFKTPPKQEEIEPPDAWDRLEKTIAKIVPPKRNPFPTVNHQLTSDR